MVAGTASLFSLLFFVLMSASGEHKIIKVKSGEDVTLTCRAPNNNISVEWSRADLGDENVLLYQDGHFVPDNQHPSFKNRVDLQDKQMKDGDVSLILKDVTINDAGTYQCHVYMEETASWKLINISLIVVVVVPDQKTITAESGQDVTLTCRAPNNNIIVVKWSRADLGDEHVLVYRDDQVTPDDQHQSFKNRVDLQDRQMKDGDVSLILKDVTINDTGTYECHVLIEKPWQWSNISIIYLHVVPPGQTGGQEKDGGNKDGGKEDKEKEDGSVGLIVGLSVLFVLLLVAAAVGFLIYRKHKQQQSEETNQPPV